MSTAYMPYTVEIASEPKPEDMNALDFPKWRLGILTKAWDSRDIGSPAIFTGTELILPKSGQFASEPKHYMMRHLRIGEKVTFTGVPQS